MPASSVLRRPAVSLPAEGSGLTARALLGWMEREQALKFLMEDCLFSPPLTLRFAAEIWEFYKSIVKNSVSEESGPGRKLPLSAADLKAARKFRSKHPDAHYVVDFVRLNPMDLVVHQLWISTDISERYKDRVTPDKWLQTALLDPPSNSRSRCGASLRRVPTSFTACTHSQVNLCKRCVCDTERHRKCLSHRT